MKKKALIICEAFYPEDFIINDLVLEWKKKGYEFEVLTRTPSYPFGKVYDGYMNKIYQQTDFNGIKVHRFPVVQGYHKSVLIKIINYISFVFWSCLIGLFIGRKFDRIFVYQTGPLTVALPAIIIKKIYGSSVTIWTQDLWPETVYAYGFKKRKLLKIFLDKFVKFIYKNCDIILVSCEGFIPKIQRYVNHKSFYWIPNWSLVAYQPNSKIELKGKFNFTFAGNIGKVQNLENVILGFELFVKDYPDAFFNIIGDGSNLEYLKKLVCKRKIVNIDFLGRKPLSEMSNYYHASDVLIISLINSPIFELTIPSKFQVYLETEKPIMAVLEGEVSSLVNENKIGFTAKPNDVFGISLLFKKMRKIQSRELIEISIRSKKIKAIKFSRNELIIKLTSVFFLDKL
ncbi:MAG: glycosyltransferase family 4 protein [Flavobacteriaceae bacterium]|nr:glycosyltransferase family 4 protein [Flavobacteriaceae bacterium]